MAAADPIRNRAIAALEATKCIAGSRYVVADALRVDRPIDQEALETLERAAAGLAGAAPPAPAVELVPAPAGPRFVRLTRRNSPRGNRPIDVNPASVHSVEPVEIRDGFDGSLLPGSYTSLRIAGHEGDVDVSESFDTVLALLSGAEPGAER